MSQAPGSATTSLQNPQPPRPRRIFITVAEVSGDMHAAHLIKSLLQLDPTLQIEGLGGPAMRAAGAKIHHETVGNAAMGAAGFLRAFEMIGLIRWTKRYFREHPPDLQICCDSPAMNFHFAKLARRRGIPVLYYIAPQLWAWREGRMRKLRRTVDHVACILPFEEAYFRGHGVPATYVGHPLFDSLPQRNSAVTTMAADAPLPAPTIGLLPGSRRGEAKANFPPMLKIADRIRAAFPAATFLVPTTGATHLLVEQLASGIPNMTVSLDGFDEMVPRADLCITVSGTATLHVAGHGVPMLVVYRLNPALWHGAGRWLVRTRTFALVNLLAGTHVVPEFVPWFGDPIPVADAAIDLLQRPAKLAEQREQLARLVRTLDGRGASLNVARLGLQLMSVPVQGAH